ncbi:heat shock 70 kDa protein 14-like [Phalaenopsis equestris]|uniref:heat shock 70 kDa protein 14-like n=1 Tax=Phalaenopsis equestris TaxID=78828 RepID=UPI0009E4CED4|nr:heat shock 70 kDa protein 14-like [Phalaenopsis equestris]
MEETSRLLSMIATPTRGLVFANDKRLQDAQLQRIQHRNANCKKQRDFLCEKRRCQKEAENLLTHIPEGNIYHPESEIPPILDVLCMGCPTCNADIVACTSATGAFMECPDCNVLHLECYSTLEDYVSSDDGFQTIDYLMNEEPYVPLSTEPYILSDVESYILLHVGTIPSWIPVDVEIREHPLQPLIINRSLGGRDFDDVLFKYFAAKFKDEYKIDVFQNARARLRLSAACEKLKKMLSANPEAPLNIECLMDEKDVRGFIKREEFEKISASILERVKGPLVNALQEAGLTVENIHSVEVVGSGSRVPAIIKILTEFFGKEPRRTLNASECVARGCALQCAILSPTFKVREFQVHESFPFTVALSWKGSNNDSQNEALDAQQSVVVFPKGNPIPSVKALTFIRSNTFSVDITYASVNDNFLPPKISTYTV